MLYCTALRGYLRVPHPAAFPSESEPTDRNLADRFGSVIPHLCSFVFFMFITKFAQSHITVRFNAIHGEWKLTDNDVLEKAIWDI